MIATLEVSPATPGAGSHHLLHDRVVSSSVADPLQHFSPVELIEHADNRIIVRGESPASVVLRVLSCGSNNPLFPADDEGKEIIEREIETSAAVNLSTASRPETLLSQYSEMSQLSVKDWDGTKFYSDFIKEGLEYNNKSAGNVVMLFESPSSSATNTSFHNADQFKFHDWPAPRDHKVKGVLGPCRYSLMNGSTLPAFLRGGIPPPGLVDHWSKTVPGSVTPTFVSEIADDTTVYAYLPVEQIKSHVNDPHTHYHLVGKDTIARITNKTTKIIPDTRTSRPCVVKTTHSMGGKGIFIIRDDEDEAKFEKFLVDSGNPNYVVTEFVDIARNVACHFFMHPNGTDVTWFGSNENKRLPDGTFSSDSYLDLADQGNLKKMQLPFVEDVVKSCKSLGFWGFCGIDVLFDSAGRGYLVDINPRVTGSCPGLMTLELMHQHFGFQVGLLRRSGHINFYGTPKELLEQVESYNDKHVGNSRVVIHSMFQPDQAAGSPDLCRINIAVYGNDMDTCRTVLNQFAKPPRPKVQAQKA